ncbi:hypothetical protein SpCBS45565_g00102 [Spizellomyces sp. 'palustris']|nr:hypothetical protein SpCBS45565_g00102 [Spizellomyces sp. 'palustris']
MTCIPDTPLTFASKGIPHRYIQDPTKQTTTLCWKCGGTGQKPTKTKQKSTPLDCSPCQGTGTISPAPRTTCKPFIRPFKPPYGWTPRGPQAFGDAHDPLWAPRPGEMLTSLSGHWMIYQLVHGHRYTTDDVLTAAIAVTHMKGTQVDTYVDLGTGLGSVLGMVAWSLGVPKAVGIEAQVIHVELARKTLLFNGCKNLEIVHGDLRGEVNVDPAMLVTGTPPYFPSNRGALPTHPNRGMCAFELRGGVETYCFAAARYLHRSDKARFVFCQTGLEVVRSELAIKRVGMRIHERWDVWGRAGQSQALLCVFCCGWGEWVDGFRVVRLDVRDKDGNVSREMRVLMDLVGKAVLV